MGQLISRRWTAARDEILDLAGTEPQIQYERFAETCERHGVTGPEIAALVELMHDLGHVIYYGEDEGLKDIVVLNAEWLTKAISYVLEDKPTRDAGGILDHARLREIWQDRNSASAYPARYHRYFLRLMEKFDVSYRLDGDELRSLVAQLVPHERPVLPWQFRTQSPAGLRTLALVCRLSEPAPGLIPWLTVRHHRAATGLYWRRGVFLRHPNRAYASEALVELSTNTDLRLEVRAPSPDLYFNVLRDSVEDLVAHRWPGLAYQLFVPCPGKTADKRMCGGQFPLDGLLRLREHGHLTYPCTECAQPYEVSLLLTGFAGPGQPIGAELQQMHDQLARIESSIMRVEGHTAQIAMSVRRVLRVVSSEVTDCPGLFSLVREHSLASKRTHFYQDHYRLTLWCEHPGYWHPWIPASYNLDPPKDWFARIGPYAAVIVKLLKLIVPVAGSAVSLVLPPDQLARAQSDLALMSAIVSELPSDLGQANSGLGLGAPTDRLTAAEGKGLRSLRSIVFDRDKLRAFGGLQRVQAPSGDFLWVCRDHYSEYDPGLPIVP